MENAPKRPTLAHQTIPDRESSDGSVGFDKWIDLRVTFGDMSPEHALRITLPSDYADVTLHEFINELFPEKEADQERIIGSLNIRDNPDLPDIYMALLDVIEEWRGSHSTLQFYLNKGVEIDLQDRISKHLASGNQQDNSIADNLFFDLVIERNYDVLSKYAELGEDSQKLLNWLKGCTLIYFMDKHGYRPPVDTTQRDWHFEFAVEDLRARGLIAPNREAISYLITREGRRFIGHTISETESYIKHFDVFKDVEYDAELEIIRFGTGRGDDLRVQVFEAEDLDVIRVVFLLRLYDGTFDGYKNTWLENIKTVDFFNEILRPVLDHDRADDELLDWIIESGYAHNEEQAELAREKASQKEIMRRLESK